MGEATAPKTRWWQTALALAVCGVAALALWLIVRTAWRSLVSVENQLAGAIVAASTTLLVSVISVIGARYWERRNERERELRAKKVPVYEKFIGDWLELMFSSKGGELDETRARAFFTALTPQLTIWGSDEVVATWSRLRREWTRVGQDDAREPMELMFEFEALLLKIRRDLGHGNKGLKPGDLLGLWVNDIHEYAPTAPPVSRIA